MRFKSAGIGQQKSMKTKEFHVYHTLCLNQYTTYLEFVTRIPS